MLRYKNVSDHDLQVVNIPGVGVVKSGDTVESILPIENPNFELVSDAPAAPAQPAPAPAAAPVAPAAPAQPQAVEQPTQPVTPQENK